MESVLDVDVLFEVEEEKEVDLIPTGNAVIFDIETGPRPWEEIAEFFEPPEHPGEFDSTVVKYGNTKDPEKRQQKLDEAKAAHAATVATFVNKVTAAKAEFVKEAALSPVTGEVLAIGTIQNGQPIILGDGTRTEADILATFWGIYTRATRANQSMVGFNIFGFDLPFMVRRSWLLDVDIPADVIRDNRYWSRVFIDLMAIWGLGTYGERIKLDRVAAYFGCTRKSGSGAEFAGLWNEPATRQQAIDYLKTDLQVTADVARKLGVC